jgi:hypothetical protein
MTFGSTLSRCHVCRKSWATGCVPKYVCPECKALGHLDSLDCPKCDREYLAGVVDGLLDRLKELEGVVNEAIEIVEGRPVRSPWVAVEDWKKIRGHKTSGREAQK